MKKVKSEMTYKLFSFLLPLLTLLYTPPVPFDPFRFLEFSGLTIYTPFQKTSRESAQIVNSVPGHHFPVNALLTLIESIMIIALCKILFREKHDFPKANKDQW